MWEIIQQMWDDHLWIYTGIAGAILGGIVLAYMRTTALGLWFYDKVDTSVDWMVKKLGLSWLKQKPSTDELLADMATELEAVNAKIREILEWQDQNKGK